MRAVRKNRWGSGGVALAIVIVAASAEARADQVVVLDETWVHTPDMPDSHYRVPPLAGTPSDWTSPVDYSQGSAWVYLEVHTKPTDQETKFQVCFEATPTYACTYQSPTYTEVGTYEWETPFSDFWSPPGELVDWSQGTNQIANILKDTMNGKPSADNVGEEIAALYTPTEVRLVVTLVEAGGVYDPPTPTGEGGTGTGGGSGGSGSDDGGDETGTAASTGGVPPDPGGTSSDGDGQAADDGPGPPPATGSGDGDGSTGSADPSGAESDGGCACTSSPDRGSGPAFGVACLAAIAGLTRRRGVDAGPRQPSDRTQPSNCGR